MAIIRWRPFRDFDRFFEEDWETSPMVPSRGVKFPDVDIYQTDKNVVVEMPLAGVKPEDVDISVENDILIVKGESKEEKEEKKKTYWKKEIRRGSFERSVALPTEVKGQRADAESKDGMLRITLPKAKPKKAKKVKVKMRK